MLAPTVERLSDRDASRPTRARSATQSSFDADLARAVREVRLLAAVTPCNLAEERARLLRELGRGNASNPRYGYVPASRSELRLTLAGLWESSATAVPDRLLGVYRARIEELDLEARIAESAGTLRLGDLAASRFAEEAPAAPGKPFAGVTEWLKLPAPAERGGVRSDALDPTSLLSSMRRAVGEARLPFRVEVSETLSSRAATGERTLWVAKGRLLTAEETRRTVAHEIDGHALPRARAASRPAIFAIGTARGADHQEGYALVIEERQGLLNDARRRELAARHWAVSAMSRGACFAEVTRALVVDHAVAKDTALSIAERAFRGSSGRAPGLGRERVYIGAWLRVRAHLARCPEDEAVLASGQVAVTAAAALWS
jgi:hypothetical protein